MAQKTHQHTAGDTAPSVKICFERIIPDELDPERLVHRAMRVEMLIRAASDAGSVLNPDEVAHVARMALVNSKKWTPGTTLRCRFLDGSTTMRKKVQIYAHQWEQYANIKFKFVTSGPAEIRISFYADAGSWSAVGNCYDNAQAESFFSRFKTELVESGVFESVEQAPSETFSYLKGYYIGCDYIRV